MRENVARVPPRVVLAGQARRKLAPLRLSVSSRALLLRRVVLGHQRCPGSTIACLVVFTGRTGAAGHPGRPSTSAWCAAQPGTWCCLWVVLATLLSWVHVVYVRAGGDGATLAIGKIAVAQWVNMQAACRQGCAGRATVRHKHACGAECGAGRVRPLGSRPSPASDISASC
jgi:hypothetical protein